MVINSSLNRIVLFFCLVASLISTNALTAVLSIDKQWPKGSTLNILFLDGKAEHHQLVRKIAPKWITDTSLSFRFYSNDQSVPNQTHIRISFTLQNGSQLGDHKDYLSKTATMNLHGLTLKDQTSEAKIRLILHEFGHALGLEHEYRSRYWPYENQPIKKLISDCYPQMELIGYNKQEAVTRCEQINSKLGRTQAKFTAFDANSIMNYPMNFKLEDGTRVKISASNKLSILDKYAIQQWYAK